MAIDLKKIQQIATSVQKSLFKDANFQSTGIFKSHLKGSGLQFREHQVYEHGDDVRFIDWKLSAKMKRPYIKTFEEERNLSISVIIHLRPSLMMGFDKLSKLEAALNLSFLLAMITEKTKDKVQLSIVCADPKLSFETPLKVGRDFILHVLRELNLRGYLLSNGDFNRDLEIEEALLLDRQLQIKKYIMAKRETVYISDYFEEEQNPWKVFWGMRKFHGVSLTIPLDLAKKIPFSIVINNSKQSALVSQNFASAIPKSLEEQLLSKRLIQCPIEQNYLDLFLHQLRNN